MSMMLYCTSKDILSVVVLIICSVKKYFLLQAVWE